MSELFTVTARFDKPGDYGFLREHGAHAERLFALVTDKTVADLAKIKNVSDWRELAEQACEDYARWLVLKSDTDPSLETARRKRNG